MTHKRNFLIISSFLIFIFIILTFMTIFLFENEIVFYFIEKAGNFLILSVFILSFLLEFIPQSISPHAIILGIGFLGILDIILLSFVLIGSFFGSMAGFIVGKKYGMNFVNDFLKEHKMKNVEKRIDRYGKWFILLTAITPLPYLPLLVGALKINMKSFIFFGIVPRLLGLIVVSMYF